MPDIAVNIDPAAIENAVIKAVVDSSIGAEIEKAIKDLISRQHFGKSFLEGSVANVVRVVTLDLIHSEFKPLIEAAVREFLTEAFVSKMTEATMAKIQSEIGISRIDYPDL